MRRDLKYLNFLKMVDPNVDPRVAFGLDLQASLPFFMATLVLCVGLTWIIRDFRRREYEQRMAEMEDRVFLAGLTIFFLISLGSAFYFFGSPGHLIDDPDTEGMDLHPDDRQKTTPYQAKKWTDLRYTSHLINFIFGWIVAGILISSCQWATSKQDTGERTD